MTMKEESNRKRMTQIKDDMKNKEQSNRRRKDAMTKKEQSKWKRQDEMTKEKSKRKRMM